MENKSFEDRMKGLDVVSQLEIYKFKSELLEENLAQYKKREAYWQNQNQYMLESINAKIHAFLLSTYPQNICLPSI